MWNVLDGKSQRRNRRQKKISANHNDSWTCPWPFYINLHGGLGLNAPGKYSKVQILFSGMKSDKNVPFP